RQALDKNLPVQVRGLRCAVQSQLSIQDRAQAFRITKPNRVSNKGKVKLGLWPEGEETANRYVAPASLALELGNLYLIVLDQELAVHFFDSQRRGRGKERTIQDAYLSSNVRMAPVAGGVDNELQLSGIFRFAIQNVQQFQIDTSPRGKTQRRRAFER